MKKLTGKTLYLTMAFMAVLALSLMGTTYAWFSASLRSSGNRIVSGTLSATLIKYDAAKGEYLEAGESSPVVTANNFQPGDSIVAYVGVKNIGSIDFYYDIMIQTDDSALNPAIELSVARNTVYSASDPDGESITFTDLGALSALSPKNSYIIPNIAGDIAGGGNTDMFALKFTMRNDASIDFQGRAVGFSVTVMARQKNSSFVRIFDESDFENVVSGSTVRLMNNIELTGPLTIANAVNLELGGFTVTGDITIINVTQAGTMDISDGYINGELTINTPNVYLKIIPKSDSIAKTVNIVACMNADDFIS